MLAPEERAEIEAEFPHYPNRKAVCIDAMKIVQKHRGWVPDEALHDIGELLGMSQTDLDGIATFYNLIFRRPVGRHVIYLCDSVSCWIMGLDALRSQLKQKLNVDFGETSEDGQYTLLPVACLGACDHAPALLLDGELHGDMNTQKLDVLVGRRG